VAYLRIGVDQEIGHGLDEHGRRHEGVEHADDLIRALGLVGPQLDLSLHLLALLALKLVL
jgi:hypothetical protein